MGLTIRELHRNGVKHDGFPHDFVTWIRHHRLKSSRDPSLIALHGILTQTLFTYLVEISQCTIFKYSNEFQPYVETASHRHLQRSASSPITQVAELTQSPELLFLGREYPLGFDYFRPRLHKAFISKASERDEDKIRQGIAQAEYVKKGTVP